jgi:hypothetical protein
MILPPFVAKITFCRTLCRLWGDLPARQSGLHIVQPPRLTFLVQPIKSAPEMIATRCFDRVGSALSHGLQFYGTAAMLCQSV